MYLLHLFVTFFQDDLDSSSSVFSTTALEERQRNMKHDVVGFSLIPHQLYTEFPPRCGEEYRVPKVRDNGNCFFNAVSVAVYGKKLSPVLILSN